MKKNYLSLIILLLFFVFNATAASGTIDLTGKKLVSLEGDTFDLEQIQNDGYTIIFDFWATWCGPCLASTPSLDDIWQAHGPDGDQTFMVFSIETDVSTTNEVAIINQYNINNPVFLGEDNTTLRASDFAYGGSIPYFTVVCPDGTWRDHGGAVFSPNTLMDKAICFADDAKLSNSVEGSNCPSSSWLPEVTIKNVGTTNITTASIEISVNGSFHEVIDWNGTLQTEQEGTINGTIPIQYTGIGTQEVEYNITTVNTGIDGNTRNNKLIKTKSFNISTTLDVSLELIIDDYPEEMGYQVKSSDGAIVSSANAGAYNNATTNPIINITLPSTEECYEIKLSDSFGDGSGGFILKDASNNNVIVNTEVFSDTLKSQFYVSSDNDSDSYSNIIEDLNGSDKDDQTSTPLTELNIINTSKVSVFNVYPNPATTSFNVELEMVNVQNAAIEITDLLGRKVNSKLVSGSISTFNTSNLDTGIYFVNVTSGEKVIANSKIFIK